MNYKNLFSLPDEVTYLNAAYMTPLPKSVELTGIRALSRKSRPYEIGGNDFFTDAKLLREEFSRLVDNPDPQRIALIPSVSYGIASVVKNIKLKNEDEILVVSEQFPSNIYAWQKLAMQYRAKLRIIQPPREFTSRGERWNNRIIEAINPKTAVVALPQVHWADGTLFDLKAIRKVTEDNHALLIIDGTQSVGAFPFSISEIRPDALICAGYKWLMGPYSTGVAYYSEYFDNGEPIEENWINRKHSDDFTGLVNYESEYQPKAARYNVGELSNFTLLPMLLKSIRTLNEWSTGSIQEHCKDIATEAVNELRAIGCFIEEENYRGHHLFGIYLPDAIPAEKLKRELARNQIHVSFRGNAIRVSPHLYNTKADFEKLTACFKKAT